MLKLLITKEDIYVVKMLAKTFVKKLLRYKFNSKGNIENHVPFIQLHA